MVKKLTALLRREWGGLHETAILIAGFALLYQVLVLFRDHLLANVFGASQTLDLYYAAFRIPDLLFALAASLMSALVLIPILTKHAAESDARAQKFLNDTFTVFFTLFAIIAVGIFFAIPTLVPVIFRGFEPLALAKLVTMTRIMLLAPVFFALAGLLGSITQMLNTFFPFAVAPVLYNVGIMIGTALFYPAFGPAGLAWGVVLGAFLNFFVYFFVCFRNDFGLTFSFRPSFIDLWEVVRNAFHRIIGLVSNQIALFALVAFAAGMEPGSITIFSFALSIQSVVPAVMGSSYVLSAFSGFSHHFSGEETKKFIEQIMVTSRHIIFWLLPASTLLVVLRAQIVRVVFGSGVFGWPATRLTAAALAIFAVSIIAQSLTLLFMRGFYTSDDTNIPLVASLFSAVVVALLGYGLIAEYAHSILFQNFTTSLLRVTDVGGARVLMLPLAYSAGMIFNALILIYFFQKRYSVSFFETLRKPFAHYSFASLVGGIVTYEFLVVLGIYLDLHTFRGIFLQGLGAGVSGIITWWLILEIFGNEDAQEFRQVLGSKFWKAGIIIPGKEEI